MTFIVAFARPEVALLASDTRTTMREGPDAPALSHDDAEIKIFPFRSGWIASGPSVAFRDALLAGLSPEAAIAGLEASEARIVRERRQLTVTVAPGERQVAAWDGSPRFSDAKSHEVVALCPNGSEPAVMQRLLDTYQRALHGAELGDVIDATVSLYRAVYMHCGPEGTVSPLVSIGLVFPQSRQLLGPLPTMREVVHA